MGKRKDIGKSSYSLIKNKKYKKNINKEKAESQDDDDGISKVYSSERTKQRKIKLEKMFKNESIFL